MPPIQKNGSIKINGFSRQWNAGDTPDKYLTLGDIDEALKPQLFSLSNITNIINIPNTSTLDKFPLL
ncbi:peptidase M23, partial [Brunnivagina elsteri CCALA 953]